MLLVRRAEADHAIRFALLATRERFPRRELHIPLDTSFVVGDGSLDLPTSTV